jgi:hypothetical protein
MKIVVTAQLQKLLKSKKEEYINNQLDAMDDEASRIIELGDTAEYIQHPIGCYGG